MARLKLVGVALGLLFLVAYAGPYAEALQAVRSGDFDVAAWAEQVSRKLQADAAAFGQDLGKGLGKGLERQRRRPPRSRGGGGGKPPAGVSRLARQDVPPRYLALYATTGRGERWGGRPAWAVLAGVGKEESDHGRSRAPGVRSGVNRFGCCAGPMQFNLRNGPPSTWDRYGQGGDVYDPADAIPAAGRLLRASGAGRDVRGALFAYNQDWAYVGRVLAWADRYARR